VTDGTAEEPARDESLELAYDAAKAILANQDVTLGSLRTRAGGLLTAATLLTSFSAALGLATTGPTKGVSLPGWGAWLLLAVLIVIGVLVLHILWPVATWHFGPHPGIILKLRQQGDSLVEIRQAITEKMIEGMAVNRQALKRRQTAFRVAVSCLLAEVVILISALTAAP
jgi:hypothetical protein